MARIVASVVFEDGQSIVVHASGAASYPDALAQLRHEAVEGVREIMAVVREVVEPIDGDGQ